MGIVSVQVHPTESMLRRTIQTSLGNVGPVRGVLVKIITEDGLIGTGWATENAFFAGETLIGMKSAIEEVISPFLQGKDPLEIESIMEGIENRLLFNYRAKSAVDMALHDVIGKSLGVPLYRYLGGLCRPSIASIRLIGVDSPANMSQEALELQEQGYKHFKLKLGGEALDVERVKAVCESLDPEVSIVLDPNQGYSPKGAIQLMNRLHQYTNIAILEQPVPVHDLEGMALVRRSVDVMVEADECVRNIYDAYRVIEHGAADILSLKVSKMGGIHWVLKIADLCQGAGMPCLVGADVGSSIHDLAQLHVALSHSNIRCFGCEIGESTRLVSDPITGLDIRDGLIFPPQASGLGGQERTLQ